MQVNKLVLNKHLKFYMNHAVEVSKLSSANRRKVGAVIVSSMGGTFIGYNGMPPKMTNECELEDGTTNPFVIHAEANALDKMHQEGISAKGSVCFTTCYPCVECAKRLCAAGIKTVVYKDEYHTQLASELFEHYGVVVIRCSL